MKTTLRKLISEIDFNNKKIQCSPDWEELSSIFNINNLYYSEDERLKVYFIKKWYCTDSYVGLRAYFLNGVFVATSYQVGRKADEDFSFVSKALALELKNYLLEISVNEEIEPNYDIIDESDLDEEIPNTYKIEFNTQILHKTALLNGERVEILKTRYNWGDDRYFHTVEIKNTKGKKEEIHCQELDFEYNV